jgi:hypothetical protein
MCRCLAMTLLMLSVGLTCQAQSPDAGAGNSNSAKPAPQAGSNTPSTSATPSAPEAASTDKATTTDKKKPKKVWTNDEIGSVKGGISVVGDGKSATSRRPAPESHDSYDAHAELVRNYRDQIHQLREQIDAADSRIEQLKNFKGENTGAAAGININQGYNTVPVEEQVKQLEERKKKLRAKIDDVEVEAKKNGLDPGELR